MSVNQKMLSLVWIWASIITRCLVFFVPLNICLSATLFYFPPTDTIPLGGSPPNQYSYWWHTGLLVMMRLTMAWWWINVSVITLLHGDLVLCFFAWFILLWPRPDHFYCQINSKGGLGLGLGKTMARYCITAFSKDCSLAFPFPLCGKALKSREVIPANNPLHGIFCKTIQFVVTSSYPQKI